MGSPRAWIAVYDHAADPQDLSSGRQQILDALGDALEGSVVVVPASCFEGIPSDLDQGDYVLALQQTGRVYVRALAEQLDGHPVFVGAVHVLCTD